MRALILPLLLAGCAAGQSPSSAGAEDELARALSGRAAGEAQRCVQVASNQSPRVIDGQTLLYERGRTLYVNRLMSDCPGIRPFNTLIVEVYGGQHCRGDRVRGLEPGSSIAGPACLLGDFVPYRRVEDQ